VSKSFAITVPEQIKVLLICHKILGIKATHFFSFLFSMEFGSRTNKMNARLELITSSALNKNASMLQEREPSILESLTSASRSIEPIEMESAFIPLWLSRVIESVAFGMAVLDTHRRVLMCNSTAREALADCGLAMTLGKVVPWVTTPQGDRVQRALLQSTEGWRRMLILKSDDEYPSDNPDEEKKLIVSLSPITLDDGQSGILLTTEKSAVCSAQTIASYANLYGLTASETNVLGQLAHGFSPDLVANRLNISIATIRSHIKGILLKTNCSCVRTLLVKVAKLPPMVGNVAGLNG
jgi:DNA-binding CsgD family transcriptional regulator